MFMIEGQIASTGSSGSTGIAFTSRSSKSSCILVDADVDGVWGELISPSLNSSHTKGASSSLASERSLRRSASVCSRSVTCFQPRCDSERFRGELGLFGGLGKELQNLRTTLSTSRASKEVHIIEKMVDSSFSLAKS